ncbi:hypothetical protein ACC689_07285 [Rhizobium ruizarguesonis]
MSEEMTGIAAFVPESIANQVETGNSDTITLLHRPNDTSVTFVVKRSDVERIVPGGLDGDHRLMQIVLRPGSFVETKIEMLRNVKSLQDPTLKHLTAPAISTHSSLPIDS